jgi:hypothetical protein
MPNIQYLESYLLMQAIKPIKKKVTKSLENVFRQCDWCVSYLHNSILQQMCYSHPPTSVAVRWQTTQGARVLILTVLRLKCVYFSFCSQQSQQEFVYKVIFVYTSYQLWMYIILKGKRNSKIKCKIIIYRSVPLVWSNG